MPKAAQPFTIERYQHLFRVVPDACWPWTGALNTAGYGVALDPRTRRAGKGHRLIYELLVGPIPEGLQLDHLCRNRRCVNPAHLEPVTTTENTRRGAEAVKATCIRGHVFDEANTSVPRPGHRLCRACARLKSRVLHAEKRGLTGPKVEADRLAYYSVRRPTAPRHRT